MQYGRRLIESRPFLTRIPDDSVIVADRRADAPCPARARNRFVATRDSDRQLRDGLRAGGSQVQRADGQDQPARR